MHTTLHCKPRRQGFTLIELLVVISIIALLVAILLPALKAARDQAKQTLCMSNMRQYGMIAMLYDNDFKELPNTSGNSNVHNQFVVKVINSLFDSYGMQNKLRWCPSAPDWQRSISNRHIVMFDLLGGRHDYTSGANTYGWRHITRNWPLRTSGWIPQLSVSQPVAKSVSVMPYFYADIVHESASPNVTIPPVANHRKGNGRAAGGHLLFLDGHVEWNSYEPGQSWKAGGSAYLNHWINSPSVTPPPGATFLAP